MTRACLTLTAAAALSAASCFPASAQTPAGFELFTNLATHTATGENVLDYAVAGDFNSDGKPDLITSANGGFMGDGPALRFFAGNGDGTFQPPIAIADSAGQQVLFTADLNGDGIPDLLTQSVSPSDDEVLDFDAFYGNGDGTFNGPVSLLTHQFLSGLIAVGDLNGDGLPDIALFTALGRGSGAYIGTFLNTGYGSFVPGTAINLPQQTYAVSLQVADVDRDGHPDLVYGTDGATQPAAMIAWGKGNDTFTAPVVLRSYGAAGTETAGGVLTSVSDVNQDGAPDVLANFCPQYNETGQGGPGSMNCSTLDVFYGGQGSHKTFYRNAFNDTSMDTILSPMAVDVNGDGIADIVASGNDDVANKGLFVWYGHADGSFNQTHQRFTTSYYVGSPVTADFNRDGKMDFFLPVAGTEYLNTTPTAPCATSQISPTVTVCAPVNQTYMPSNAVTVQANAYDRNPVTALQLYADGDLVESERTTAFTVPLGLATGSHLLVTKAWDSKGISFRSPRTITVYNGTPGSVCNAPMTGAAICLPGDNTGNMTHVIANGYTGAVPDAVQLYVDGSLAVNNNTGGSTAIDTRLALSSGSHSLVFKLWDANGNVYTAQKTVTVAQ